MVVKEEGLVLWGRWPPCEWDPGWPAVEIRFDAWLKMDAPNPKSFPVTVS